MMHIPFIESQFPLSILSAESYKERKAGSGQTLTGLGKWWGRKPLILVRAVLLGLLLPASKDPEKDREVFLRILTMDPDGLWKRKNKPVPVGRVVQLVSPKELDGLVDSSTGIAKWASGFDKHARSSLEQHAFNRMGYEEKLTLCVRPEQIDGPSEKSWEVINNYLGTSATTLPQLFDQLATNSFGRAIKVGDVFCGGGSIPFEAARMGMETWGSDLNPVATLLSWAAIHLMGGGPEVQARVKNAQHAAWEAADRQVTEWGIEHDRHGARADTYLYCIEAQSPATGIWVPLAPSWVISDKYKVIAILSLREDRTGYEIEIKTGANGPEMTKAKKGTVQNGSLVCPETGNTYSMASLRGANGLRHWDNGDVIPRTDDVLQERLYCVRWVMPNGEREYRSVTTEDLARDRRVLELLEERFEAWQEKGFIPSKVITPGYNTAQPIRERGWTHWHHLFHPRQLLVNAAFSAFSVEDTIEGSVAVTIRRGVLQNWNSRLVIWNKDASKGPGATEQTFANQALNTQYNFGVRTLLTSKDSFLASFNTIPVSGTGLIQPLDARSVKYNADFWITDPPYADAVNYHELADFFLAWYEKHLPNLFPDWYNDGRPALAVKGADEDFKRSMVEIYGNLATHMPDDGFQVVMFTHQDAGVWADLGMILWAAGLRVSAAWTIGTETTSGLKKGNYVQGTVLLVLRKRLGDDSVYLDELYPEVDDEVRSQLAHMHDVEDELTPQFGDTDYQLAAYAAALRVLTGYADIEGLDIRHELFRARAKNEKSPFERVIDRAVSIAVNYLIPRGIDPHVWRALTTLERLYLRGIELERNRELRQGAYTELARGFGVQEYKFLLADGQANSARMKTPTEFGTTKLGDDEWGQSLIRHVLHAVSVAVDTDNPREGLNYLKAARPDYWGRREIVLTVLKYMVEQLHYSHLPHWQDAASRSELLLGLVQNDYGGS